MARYQVLIEYVGTSFRGWQIQKKGSTIQGLIQQQAGQNFHSQAGVAMPRERHLSDAQLRLGRSRRALCGSAISTQALLD